MQTKRIACLISALCLAACAGSSPQADPPGIILDEWEIRGELTTPAAEVTVANTGALPHNLVVEGIRTPDLRAGTIDTIDLSSLSPGTYRVVCDIAGHEEAGMVADLVVTG